MSFSNFARLIFIYPKAGLVFFFFFLISADNVCAEESKGNSLPAYYGGTGLLDMPTARVMDDWNLRVHYSSAEPYYTYGMTATFLPWMEINARVIQISGVPSGLSDDYGDYKDKAFDLKLSILDESDSWPALAIGANDIHGTALFGSRYIAASKLIGPVDVTLGLGQGILAGDTTAGGGSSGDASNDAGYSFLTSELTRDTKPFGGVELRVTKKISLQAEYSSMEYEKLTGIDTPATSPFNFGAKYKLAGDSQLSASYMRGDVFGWSLSGNLPFNPEGFMPWQQKPFWNPGESLKQKALDASNEELALIIREAVAGEKFSNVRTSVSDASVWVEIENPTYQSNNKALGRALRIVSSLAPARIEWIYVSLKSRDLVLLTIKIARQDFEAFIDERMAGNNLLEFVDVSNEGNELRQEFLTKEIGASPLSDVFGSKKLVFAIKPSFQSFLNDPSGAFKSKFSLLWKAFYLPWQGGIFGAWLRTPLYSDIETSVSVAERDQVRTDFVNYFGDSSVRLDKLVFDQVVDLPWKWLARGEIGLLETQYGGVAEEVFRFFDDGRWGIGFEAVQAWKRELENNFKLIDGKKYETIHTNLYYRLSPQLEVDAGLTLGRFLAGDWGGRLTVSRTYKYFTMGFWYTMTDTSDFVSTSNRGYHDKGVFLSIPYSIFTDKDTPARLNYAISPWTRDVGQGVGQINNLYPMAERGRIGEFRGHIEEMKQ